VLDLAAMPVAASSAAAVRPLPSPCDETSATEGHPQTRRPRTPGLSAGPANGPARCRAKPPGSRRGRCPSEDESVHNAVPLQPPRSRDRVEHARARGSKRWSHDAEPCRGRPAVSPVRARVRRPIPFRRRLPGARGLCGTSRSTARSSLEGPTERFPHDAASSTTEATCRRESLAAIRPIRRGVQRWDLRTVSGLAALGLFDGPGLRKR